MTLEQLQNVLQAKPFRPFKVHTADGDTIPVQSREFVSISPTGMTAVVWQPDGSMNIVDVLLMTKLEVAPPNGHRPRKKK